jgi:membrane-associated phospholipid phosphatase
MIKLIQTALCLLLLFSCKTKKTAENTAWKEVTNNPILFCKTVKQLNDVVLQGNFPPMIASRNYAYALIAAYECMAAGDSNYISLSGQIKHLPVMPRPKEKEIDHNLASLFAFIKVGNAVTFPEGSMMQFYEQLKDSVKKSGMPNAILNATINYSDAVVKTILDWSKKDNYLQLRTAEKYNVIEEAGRWMPTPPAYTQAVEPHWKEIRTLVLDSAAQFMPPRPPVFDMNKNSSYYKALMEVVNTGKQLTDEQKHIADFFDDNPFKMVVSGHMMFATKKFSPPGHWLNIIGIAAEKSKADFHATVYAYCKTAIALFDGFISCWDEKYRSNYVRPETVINKSVQPDWQPYIQTPPFPSYTSGHSTTSAAAAEVMTDIFGDGFKYTDTSEAEFGIAHRSFTSFRQAAQEASISRLYGGIHYRFDCDEGAKAGEKIGVFIVRRLKMKK